MKLFLFNNNEKLIGTVTPLEAVQNEELNKIITLEATTMYSSLVESASYIGHKDYKNKSMFHLYKIDHINKTSTTDVKIVAVDSFFDDMESDGYIKDYRPKGKSVMNILQVILEGSRWKLGKVRATNLVSTNFYYMSRKEAISKLIEATGVEIRPRIELSRGKIINRYLDVYPRLGSDYGKVFIHGKDLLTVSEKKSQGAIYTAAVGRGKGEEVADDTGEATGGYGRRITFKDVVWSKRSGNPVDKPKGQEYVEIPELTKIYGFEEGTKPRVKIVEFQDEEDPTNLLRLTYEWLEKNSRVQVEYSATVLNVGNCDLGDTVGIYNPTIGIKYKTRVFKVKRNLIDNSLTEFGIGDKVISSPYSRTIELAKDIKNLENNTVYWLDRIREKLSDSFLAEDGYNYDLKTDNEHKLPAGLYSFDKPIDQNPTKVVYVGAGKIAIAKSKKPNGEWDWKTFLDGSGATLDLMNAGTLRAGIITSADGSSYWNLDTGELHLSQSAVSEVTTSEVNRIFNSRKEELKGAPGKNGIDGRPGRDGMDSYIHRKYSRNANGNPMSDDSNLDFIGIYTGRSATPPTNANQYTWSRIKGRDGANGVPGAKGADGRTSYFHTAYANSQDGRQDFSTTDSFNKIYVGTYSDFTEADSTDPTKYTWTKIKGDDGRPGRDGINGRNGDSFARNYLAGTAEPHTSTLVNDNFSVDTTVYNFVDKKSLRELGFKVGDKVTFVCDYEVIDNKKISSLRYEYYGDSGYKYHTYVETKTKGTFVDTKVVNDALLDSKRIALRADNVNAKIITSNARVIKGDKAEPWTIAQEDLRGESNYIHRKYSNNANGSGMSDNYNQNYIGIYTGFSKTPPTNPSEYTWSKIKGQDGANGAPGARGADGRTSYIHTAYANSADGRRDFSTTDSNREYLGTYSDFTEADSTDPTKYSWTKVKGAQGVTPNPNLLFNTEIKSLEGINKSGSQPNNVKINPNDYNGHNSLEWRETGLTSFYWRGFLFSSNVKKFKKGDKIVVRVPVYIFSDVNLDGGFYLELKNHATNTSFPFNLGEGTPRNIWVVKEFKLTVDRDFEFSSADWAYFWLSKNGHVKIAEPYVGYGDEVPGSWSPAFEDLQGHSLTASLRFEGTYINNVTNNVKVFVDVFYDGQKITDGFTLNWKYNGGNRTTWTGFIGNTAVNNDGYIPAINWGNATQNGTPLECIVSVSYKGLNALASGRMENMPDIVEIKETIKKYKTFDSTLEQFNSTIGEIREQTINGGRNYALGTTSDWDEFTHFESTNGVNAGGNFYKVVLDGLQVGDKLHYKTEISIDNVVRFGNMNMTANLQCFGNVTGWEVWGRILERPLGGLNEGQNYKGFIEFDATVTPTVLKNNYLIVNVRLDGVKSADVHFKKLKIEKGTLATDWTPAPEDIHLVEKRLETSIIQNKSDIDLRVKNNNVIASINLSTENDDQGVVKIKADKVDISGVLKAYRGEIGLFSIGGNNHTGSGHWFTGVDSFQVGMSDGKNGAEGAAFWASWGDAWNEQGPTAWQVLNNGKMYCKNTASFNDINVSESAYFAKCINATGGGIDVGGFDVYGAGDDGKSKTKVIWWSQLTRLKDALNSLPSDGRLKTNVKPTEVNAIDMLNRIDMVQFDWIKDGKHEQIGAIAQQVQSVNSDLIVRDMDDKQTFNGYLRINYYDFIPYLIKAIQELSEENNKLKSRVESLEERLEKLEKIIQGG